MLLTNLIHVVVIYTETFTERCDSCPFTFVKSVCKHLVFRIETQYSFQSVYSITNVILALISTFFSFLFKTWLPWHYHHDMTWPLGQPWHECSDMTTMTWPLWHNYHVMTSIFKEKESCICADVNVIYLENFSLTLQTPNHYYTIFKF